MPALITHDYFGQKALDAVLEHNAWTQEQQDVFLLGNQGPDPYFYVVLSPWLMRFSRVGSLMHAQKPSEFIAMLHESVQWLSLEEEEIGQAYLLGFCCHYLLDTTVHPFVYAQEYAICDAGIEDLSRKNGSEVHATIERELDELVLFAKQGKTIATFKPYQEILRANDNALSVISRMLGIAVYRTYGVVLPRNLFRVCVYNFRLAQRLFYSPDGIKRSLLVRAERLFRSYSFYDSMSHRTLERNASDFANDERSVWENPFTNKCHQESFFDLFDKALEQVSGMTKLLCRNDVDIAAIRAKLTQGRNFSGKVVE